MVREVGAAAGRQKLGPRAPHQPRERAGDDRREGRRAAARSGAAWRRSRASTATATASDSARIASGAIGRPIQSARYAATMADARNATADAAPASAPMSGIRRKSLSFAPRSPMFLGHFGLAFGAKKAAPAVSLGTLFAACQFADLLWPTLLLLGYERVDIAAGRRRRDAARLRQLSVLAQPAGALRLGRRCSAALYFAITARAARRRRHDRAARRQPLGARLRHAIGPTCR